MDILKSPRKKNTILNIPLGLLKNIGPKRAGIFEEAGIKTAGDLLYYLPKRYEDRSHIKKIESLNEGENCVIEAQVQSASVFSPKKGMVIFTALLKDDTGSIQAIWFNRPYLKQYIKKGISLVASGKIQRKSGLKLVSPEFEILGSSKKTTIHSRRIVPIYPLKAGLSQKWMRFAVFTALKVYTDELKDFLPTDIRARNKLLTLSQALKNIHFPDTQIMQYMALRRLIFDEFFIYQGAIALKRYKRKMLDEGYAHSTSGNLSSGLLGNLPFEITPSQKKALSDIEKDMASYAPMNRLLQGEVGSGKSVIIAYAVSIALQNGRQAAVMAPTEILARQHWSNFLKFFEGLTDAPILFLGGSLEEGERREIENAISSGEPCIVIGTHAIISKKTVFKNLGLAVIDEEHRFGVTHRNAMKEKSPSCDFLLVSATPIPRTAAMTVYGDMDITTLEGGAFSRKVFTFLLDEGQRDFAFEIVRSQIFFKRQAFIVCPAVRQAARRVSVYQAREKYKKAFPEASISTLHGKLSEAERESALNRFKEKKADILIATSIIETGIDVGNVSAMIVEDAKHFGITQLHQMRGRIGRRGQESYFIMFCGKDDESRQRLSVLSEADDALRVSEQDLGMRGPGEIFGFKQHGMKEIKIGDPLKDRQILKAARLEAFNLVIKDPELKSETGLALKAMMDDKIKKGQWGWMSG